MKLNTTTKVLHVLPTRAKEYGGPVAVAEALAEESRRMGMEVSFYPSLPQERQPGQSTGVWSAVRASDLVHIHGLWNPRATLAAIAARISGIPYVLTPHGMLDRWALRKSRLKKQIYGRLFERKNIAAAAGVHFLNTEEQTEALEYGVQMKTFVLPNGVFADRYQQLPSSSDLQHDIPQLSGKVVVLFLGRLHPKKGLAILIPALALALRKVPNLHLLIAGPDEGGYKILLEKLVDQHAIAEHVTFLGMVRDQRKLEVLAASHFFVLPSHQEGDSVAVKEAMASGLPVVITPACHFPDVALHQAGLVIEPNVDALSNALSDLGRDEELCQRMGARARQLVHDQYTWQQIMGRLAGVYDALLQSAGKRSAPPHV